MRARAATISSGDVGARLPLPDSLDEVHRLGSTLNEMLARLEQGLEHERAFVADASHELRSPLAVLKAELEVALLENGTPDELRAAVGSAVEETDRVIALAEDLLVLARAEQGSLPLNARQVNADDLVGEIRDAYEPAATQAGRALIARLEDGPLLTGDPEQLQRALSNLVDNALRYGRGPISIQTRTCGDSVELHVTDQGPGFPPELLAHAFARFTRGDNARTRGGVGLGLAIVQAIAHAHHGQAHAANRPDGGADVWLTLPRSGLDPVNATRRHHQSIREPTSQKEGCP
jgi:signal transduction histidine kinase